VAKLLARPVTELPSDDARAVVSLRDWLPWLIVCTTLAGGVLRFTILGQSYWYDEAVTVGLVRSSFFSMLRALPGTESTPPLYYGIAWVWSRIFGTTEVALRSLSALFGTAAIPVAAAAGKELISRPAGALTGALVAASPLLVWYSQEARAYSLYVLLSALSLLFFARARRSPSKRRLAWWALASALAIWTEYFAGFLVVAEALLLSLDRPSRPRLKLPLAALAGSTALLLPLVYKQVHNGRNTWIGEESLRYRVELGVRWFLGLPSHLWWVVAAVALVGLVATALASPSERRSSLVPLALAGACLLLPLASRAVGKDYWLYRNVIDAWVPLAIALAAGLVSQSARPWYGRSAFLALSLAAVALLALRSTTIITDPDKRPDWRGLANCLGRPEPGRAFLITPGYNGVVLRLYRPNVRAARNTDRGVSEIDIIGNPGARVPSGYHTEGKTCSDTISVRRLRARRLLPIPKPANGSTILVDARPDNPQ
jgi:mannosyltransferase